jgi:hypothetical protein
MWRLGRDVEQPLRVKGPWPYALSDLYYTPAVTTAVQALSTARRNYAASWAGGGEPNLASNLVLVYVHLMGLGCVLSSAK